MSHAMQEFRAGDLVKMVEEKWLGKVVVGFEVAIEASFQTDGIIRPVRTRNEIERRFKICINWFRTLRRDLGWAVPRILDALPLILRYELDGLSFTPDEAHASWMRASDVALEEDGEDMALEASGADCVEVEDI